MRQKGFIDILVIAGVLVVGLSLLFIFKSEERARLIKVVQTQVNISFDKTIPESNCAMEGEEPVSNFNLRTGKVDQSITVIKCCTGLKGIQKKQIDEIRRDKSGEVLCRMVVGVPNVICSPCGNGKCDTNYEDVCNCYEDCKE